MYSECEVVFHEKAWATSGNISLIICKIFLPSVCTPWQAIARKQRIA
nr:MAG TPA: hypothetical protein [Caudoviricetes sp.]